MSQLIRLLSLPLLPFLLHLAALPQPAAADCRLLRRGLSRDLLLLGTVLTDSGAEPDGAVFIRGGRIAFAGDVCRLSVQDGGDASVVDCSGGGGSVISPGFVNTHEHIDYATVRPFAPSPRPAGHRHDWRLGARGHDLRAVAVNGSASAAVAWGELRHLFSGTTSVIGGEMAPGLARNLDFRAGLGAGLNDDTDDDGHRHGVAVYDTFPLKDKLGIMRHGDCDYGADAVTAAVAARHHRYIGHVGEGVGPEAANEFACLSSATFDTTPAAGGGGLSADIMGPNVALVHALGLARRDFDVVAARGAMVVWSPRSNMFLYGATLDPSYLLASGITVALGTDWLPSGSATMGREAACAARAAHDGFGFDVAPRALWEMATRNGARVAGFEDVLGSLEAGKLADIVVFRPWSRGDDDDDDHIHTNHDNSDDPYAQAIFAPQEAVDLVLRGGKLLLASNPELRVLASDPDICELVPFGGGDGKKKGKGKGKEEKLVCVADELGSSFADLEADLRGVYPAVLPAVPPDEPPCRPFSYS
ncbi:putative metal dependent amidohydrolase [Rosellinia necatrix]|uniref:Putative metal dependent amidohydrolase n=1 Tax=Rosellinia necatrix TaxID=77044 RepID=A0A1W2TRS3_ROSNE|nr:putative metal dependent amidohydrolase [Rosellinia necatrix]